MWMPSRFSSVGLATVAPADGSLRGFPAALTPSEKAWLMRLDVVCAVGQLDGDEPVARDADLGHGRRSARPRLHRDDHDRVGEEGAVMAWAAVAVHREVDALQVGGLLVDRRAALATDQVADDAERVLPGEVGEPEDGADAEHADDQDHRARRPARPRRLGAEPRAASCCSWSGVAASKRPYVSVSRDGVRRGRVASPRALRV